MLPVTVNRKIGCTFSVSEWKGIPTTPCHCAGILFSIPVFLRKSDSPVITKGNILSLPVSKEGNAYNNLPDIPINKKGDYPQTPVSTKGVAT